MKTGPQHHLHTADPAQDPATPEIVREIVRAVQNVHYGSVEVIIQNSKVVQIERKEKFRFDKPRSVTRSDPDKS